MVDKLLEQLIEDFDREKLIQFYKQSSDKFRSTVSEDYSNYLPEGDSRFGKIEQIGEIEYEKQAKTIAFFVCPVSGELSDKDSKKKQYEIGKKILKDNYRDAGIFVFHGDNNFRLSLIAASYSGPKREFTTFRRYTYFVSPDLTNKTFKDQLKKCDFSSIEKILEAFSIEAVNKDFYTQIALKFTELTGGWRKVGSKKIQKEARMKLPGAIDETIYKEFAVRLIGRLIFCWFLKKKTSKNNIPLIPEGVLSTTSLDKNKGIGGYYHSILEPLFFEVLNTPLKKRNDNYQKEPWLLIPFLNGGLFTPHEHDFYDIDDTGYSKHINTLTIPNNWIRELLEIFERYNFTIDENTPVDIELSIEPEMLGRIFENLLAVINPETGETARKATGSYYTPRAIVEYMVDESLKQYLLTNTSIDEDKITELLSYADADENKLSENQKESVIQALHEVKIIDPACGSGAFPIGILQKILLVLQKLDPDSQKWLARMMSNVPDPLIRKELKKKIKVPNYIHKLGIIQDCIFGVDIQPIAVEISKLRCFLSLIVDEDVDDKQENRGIEHLPNLEFKFVCANTLINLPETEITEAKKSRSKYGPKEFKGQNLMFEAEGKIKELKELRELYLTAMPGEKKKIEDRFCKVQSDMFKHSLAWGGIESKTSKLSQWNPFSDEVSSWFDPDWMFGIKDGFDIVIANPPWGVKVSDEQRIKLSLEVNKNLDSSEYFILRSQSLMHQKSLLTFIVPKSMIFANNWRVSRQFLLNKNIVDVADAGITFKNVNLESFVFIVNNTDYSGCNNNVRISRFEPVRRYNPTKVLHQLPYISQDMMCRADSINLANLCPVSKSIVNKIQESGQFLENISREVFRGLYIPDSVKEKILDKGSTLYVNKVPDVALYIIKRVRKLDFSKISKSNKSVIEKLSRDRIIVKVLRGKKLTCTFARRELLTTEKLVNLVIMDSDTSLFYVLALLNSSLTSFYFAKAIFSDITETSRVMDDCYLRKAPVRRLCIADQKPFVSLVNKILAAKEADPQTNTKCLESQIDQMVYKLYDLTKEEIEIVKNYFKVKR